MSYTVKVDRLAGKTLRVMDKKTARRIYERLEELALDPYSTRLSKPLRMLTGRRSSRVGEWRIIYRVDEESRTIMIIGIKPRGKAYE